jgi:hypothetical protein
MVLPRPPLHDAILRPHERAANPHRQYALSSSLEALADEVAALELSGGEVGMATTETAGIVRLADVGGTQAGRAVQASDPRLNGNPLSGVAPAPLGSADAGSSIAVSRGDHRHPMPTAAQLGADPATSLARRWMLT